ncbi:hypothetical protein NE619_00685 [Anaerovorax odorimutans]|uniref:ABC-2 type transport system permease protein n=1 Tax=Anaerovorax odorimutans TaxID=109327 RepID=A0ABT1RJ92_9FIRM|nr:hypothetical protein [Anaerovorax odorimutans]MCQ4635247.1 hypothetical protein [Anaerovorax odorimutans]
MKTSYFSLSAPIIKENFRRFWALPAIAFLTYLISGIIPILANYRHGRGLALFINPLLNQAYPIYKILSLLVPVIAASLVFRYLYSRSSATIMHALPFTRSRLFNSNLLSGLLFSVLPVLLTGLILLALAKPVHFGKAASYTDEMGSINENAILSHINVFSHNMVLCWIGQTLLAVLCVYVISVFAAVISGSGIIQFFAAIGFNFLGTAFMTTLTYYFSTFLFGYVTGEKLQELITSLSPFTGLTNQMIVKPSPPLVIAYLAGSLALVVLSSVLYHKRRLERTKKAFVFRGMDTAICYLLTFFGMTLAGLVLFSDQNAKWITYAGFIGGGLVSFILGRMVVKKTLYVFSLPALKCFAAYAAIAIIFLCVLIFDLTGYTDRVPDVSQVSKVAVDDSTLRNSDARFDPSYYRDGSKMALEIYRSPENIQAIAKLHQAIISNYADKKTPESGGVVFGLHYYRDGADLERSYVVDEDFFRDSSAYKKVYESHEYKDLYRAGNLKKLGKGELSVYSSFNYSDIEIRENEREEFLKCLDADFLDRTYEEQLNKKRPCGSVYLSFKNLIPGSGYTVDGINLNLLDSDTHTLQWLSQHKSLRSLQPTADDVKEIQVYACDPAKKDQALDELNMLEPKYSSYFKKTATLTDKKQIQTVLDTCETNPDVFICEITFKQNKVFDGETIAFYYGQDSAPSFLEGLAK